MRSRVIACLGSVELLDRSRSLYSRVSPPAGSRGILDETYAGPRDGAAVGSGYAVFKAHDRPDHRLLSIDDRREVCREKNFREPLLSRIFPEEKFCGDTIKYLTSFLTPLSRVQQRPGCKLRFGLLWSLNFTSLTHKIRRLILWPLRLCSKFYVSVVRINVNFNTCIFRHATIRSFC